MYGKRAIRCIDTHINLAFIPVWILQRNKKKMMAHCEGCSRNKNICINPTCHIIKGLNIMQFELFQTFSVVSFRPNTSYSILFKNKSQSKLNYNTSKYKRDKVGLMFFIFWYTMIQQLVVYNNKIFMLQGTNMYFVAFKTYSKLFPCTMSIAFIRNSKIQGFAKVVFLFTTNQRVYN
jgi:hypothetical protein